MIPRDKFRAEISRSQALLKMGALITLITFPVLCIIGSLTSSSDQLRWTSVIGFIVMLFLAAGFIIWVYSILRLRYRIICPACNRSLGYLLTDPNYSKRWTQFGIPDDLPQGFEACPYCGQLLNEENNLQNHGLESTGAPPAAGSPETHP